MDQETLGAALVLAKKTLSNPEAIQEAVEGWLDDHPEATTTVQDGAISYSKLDASLKEKADDVTQVKNALQETAQETTGQELLAVLVAETLVTESLLEVAGNIIDHLPQDESGTDIRDALALEADRLSAIYDLWYAEKEGA